jgi:hypothetical protein
VFTAIGQGRQFADSEKVGAGKEGEGVVIGEAHTGFDFVAD